MTEVLAALTAGLLVAVSNYVFLRVQDRSRRTAELRAALADLGSSLDRLGLLVRRLPPTTAPVRSAERLLGRLPNLGGGVARLATRAFFPELSAAVEACHASINRVLLIAPGAIVEPLLELLELLAEVEAEPGPDWVERWDGKRGELIRASRNALGEAAITIRR